MRLLKANVREYVQATEGKLSLHFLPGYAPDLNPDELVWSHVKRTGTARRPLQAGEKLDVRIDAELHAAQRNPKLVRSMPIRLVPKVKTHSQHC